MNKNHNTRARLALAFAAMLALPGLALAEDPSIWDVPAGVTSAFTSAGTLALAMAAAVIACIVITKGAIIAIAIIKRFFRA